MSNEEYLMVLGERSVLTLDELKRAYLKQAKKCYSDYELIDNDKMTLLNEAYDFCYSFLVKGEGVVGDFRNEDFQKFKENLAVSSLVGGIVLGVSNVVIGSIMNTTLPTTPELVVEVLAASTILGVAAKNVSYALMKKKNNYVRLKKGKVKLKLDNFYY